MPLARPQLHDEEIEAAVAAIRSGQLCQGESTERFENAFAAQLDVRHAIAVSSGSAALLVAMQALGIEAGDEVIVPDMTFVATASAAMYLGARPVLCDIALSDYCIDPDKIAPLIGRRTKLIVPVHFGGRVAAMDRVLEMARRHGLNVLEDAAGAHLSQHQGRFAGGLGDAAIFSFTPTKPITTGEGGMITTDDDQLAERCRLIRNLGDRGKFDWHLLGFNFRMTATSAAIGCEQLKRLPDYVAQRRAIAARYEAAFAGEPAVGAPVAHDTLANNYQLYPVLLDVDSLRISRDEVIRRLAQRGVASRLYYPALHRMPVFAGAHPAADDQFPVALDYQRRALCLPIFAGMSDDEQDHVAESLTSVLREAGGS